MARASSVVASLFEEGNLGVQIYETKQADASAPPTSVRIVTPVEAGEYPVVLFLHGFLRHNYDYDKLLAHIASHGYIAVAPQLHLPLPGYEGDIKLAAAVVNWLADGLRVLLPLGVRANLRKLALAGHGQGGHSAFALALKKYAHTTLDFSVLIGIDPVAGSKNPIAGRREQASPKILAYKSDSFNIDIPVLVVGSGLAEEKELNHEEFYNECKPPSCHFVAKDYGHLDMLDDDVLGIYRLGSKSGDGSKVHMRRSIAGLAVAFLEAYLGGDKRDLLAVLRDPSVAPARLEPVREKRIGFSKL